MLPLRDDQPRYSTPWVNYFLIGLNLVIFFFEWTLDPRSLELLVRQFGVVPSHLALFLSGSPKYPLIAIVVPFFTSLFLHGGWMHVIGNMWFLYVFGDNVEDYLGHFKYLVFYLLCGLAAALTHIAFNLNSKAPTVGASGAIAGVMGAYLILYPGARVLTWFPPIFLFQVPAWVWLCIWAGLNFLNGAATSISPAAQQGGIAFWAHVGGFVTGIVLIKTFSERAQRRRYGAW